MEISNKDKAIDSVEVKKKNIRHHDVEAGFFEIAHPEGSSIYERGKVLRDIDIITDSLESKDLCVDIGCGTGFVTSFELPRYKIVVATDISRRMLEVLKRRFKNFSGVNPIVCDAENLPLRSEIADMVSVSSVLHHLPSPFYSIREITRILKLGGFLYITREPNDVRFRRFFAFLDEVVIRKFVGLVQYLLVFRSQNPTRRRIADGLDYPGVDVHYPRGFNVKGLLSFLLLNRFEVISAYSYHWVYPTATRGAVDNALSKINFIIEKVPLSRKLGRYICLIARKLA